MENYVIHFEETEREPVLNLLSQINDVIINNIEPNGVSITIQQDDAEPVYQDILKRIDREIRSKGRVLH